jgi:hypothetical protein
MKKVMSGWLAALVSFVPAGTLLAHHSIVNFDTTQAVRVKGTIVRIHQINPHSFIFVDEKGADGSSRRWAVEGPSIFQINRMGLPVPKPGDTIEVCGYVPKEHTIWQIASTDPATVSVAGRLLNAELLTMPGGQEQSWGDYGVHKCFAPGHRDQHSK